MSHYDYCINDSNKHTVMYYDSNTVTGEIKTATGWETDQFLWISQFSNLMKLLY